MIRKNTKQLCLWGLFALFCVVLLARCFFTFCQTDESFYLAITHRYWLGERPLVDEWNPEQFYAVLLLPFYSLYRAAAGSAQGVYLAARIAFTLITCGMGLWLYMALRQKGEAAAMGSALLFMLYSKANIAGFSYYNLSLYFLMAGCLLVYKADLNSRFAIVRGILAGAVMACAVLCNPVTALGWIILLPGLFLSRFKRFRTLSFGILCGTVFSAAVYLVWLLGRIGVSDIIAALPNLISDPEANTTSTGIVSLILGLASAPAHFVFTAPLWCGGFAITLYFLLYKRTALPPKAQKLVFIMAAAAMIINIPISYKILGQAHTAFCIFGLQCLLLTPWQKADKRALLCFYLPGMAFAVIWQLSSNTRFSGMTIGFALSAAACCGFTEDCIGHLQLWDKKKSRLLFLGLIILPVALSAWQRIALEYRDAPLSECSTRIEQGPAAGLYTSPEHALQYEQVYGLLTSSEIAEKDGHLFISSLLPWGYLCTERPCGAPSTWRTPLDNAQLSAYFAQNPDNFPTTVIVLAPYVGNYVSTLQPERADDPNSNAGEDSYMLSALRERGYTCLQTDIAAVYTAP